ncbi:cadherin domain-containing protein [Niveibacterium sp. SC-1]|uniref:cadherin domain-containing protein n=1 Tax=Niveibacterium sp. SC-1 TaxID=3135646 RepID=UPI0031203147
MARMSGNGFWVERIEPRILFAADHPALMGLHLGAVTDLAHPDLATPDPEPLWPDSPDQPASEIVFVDARVEGADQLINALQANQPQRLLEVHMLAAGQDAFAQIDAVLEGRHDIGALHLIGHGEAGQITLGDGAVDRASLLAHQRDLGQWGQALRHDGDILVYGCDTGAGSEGLAWTQTLAQLTGADVAASTDLTGSAALGGNWTLEREIGHLDIHPFALAAAQDWQGVLATYTVTNTNATGAGSLAQAIGDANTNPGHDTINFSIASGGPHVIVLNPAGPLPTITDGVTIDATTQPDYAGKPTVVLDGQGLPAASTGLDLGSGSGGSTIKGLAITHFANGGIGINIASSNNVIQSNYIGVDPAGNSTANSYGLIINAASSGNLVGGTLGEGNLISANSSGGVVVRGFSNTLSGNLIGTTADGLGAQGNNGFGVVLEVGSHDNLIGGSAGSRNIISGNYAVGVIVQSDHNTLQNNYIGTNLGGNGPIANTSGGVQLVGDASDNRLTGNVISGNSPFGVQYAGSAIAHGNSADHNLVGLSATGGDLGYNGAGFAIQSGSGFALSENQIGHNTGMGIDLGFDYITNANDAGDADTGPNNGQNHPDLASAKLDQGQLTVKGSLNSLPNGDYVIELFASDNPDSSGYGEGERYLGTTTVTTDAAGNVAFTLVLPASVSAGQVVTVTARNVTTGDTSEFSNAVSIVNAPNSAPVITSDGGGSGANVYVAENSTLVTTVTATDADGDTLTYSITNAGAGTDVTFFSIDPNTGVLRFNLPPDYETPADGGANNAYDVLVHVSDGKTETTQWIVVRITNVNEAPTITSDGGGASAALNVPENSTLVTTVTATDPDAASSLSYTIVGGADAGRFVINASTGQLSFASAPDFENPTDAGANNVYDVIVQVSDGSNTDTQTIAVTVTNVNEAPVITSDGGGANAALNVPENSTLVTTVTATDPDAASSLSYTIVGGADAGKFVINSSTGQLSFISAPDFENPTDAGANKVYDVIVQVSDGSITDTQAIAVTVTNVNEAPVITSDGGGANAAVSVVENGSAVTTVTATDPDAASSLSYTIVGGADAGKFVINASTGQLSFASAPDFENPTDAGGNNVYDVIVQVSDGSITDTQAIAVTVTNVNEAPVITSDGGGASAAVAVPENGTVVTTVTATDMDAASSLSYTIVGGADAGKFVINASTGQLSFASAPDFENPTDAGANNVYDVIVQVSDGSITDTQAIAVTVTNVNEAPVITSDGGGANAAVSVPENGTLVTTVTATDPDAASSLTYTIVGGADAGKFVINASTGQLSFVSAPDFENPTDAGANSVYDVIVQVSDGSITDTQAIAVTVTNVNEAPVITSDGGGANAAVSVAENGAVVTTVTATDPDAASSLSYTIVGGADASKFVINASTGQLSFASAPDFENPTDAGANNVYDVIVQVSDGSITDAQAIAVTVTDLNDNAPVITSDGGLSSAGVTVAENAQAVTAVAASDADANSTLHYSIVGGADAGKFVINAGTGQLSFVSAPDFENPTDAGADNVYDVIVQVSDGSNTDTQAIAVTVTNVNEAPVITSDGGGASAAVSVHENGAVVTTVTATDPDAASSLSYTIVGGADAGKFVINASTGQLSFVSAPDFENPTDTDGNNVYDVVVQVSDGSNTDTQSIAVSIVDLNDNAPMIISDGGAATATIQVVESGTAVTTVVAQDADAGSQLSYAIGGGADADLFVIDGRTGGLSFRTPPSFALPQDAGHDGHYEVIVVASDGQHATTQTLNVLVAPIGGLGSVLPATPSDGGTSNPVQPHVPGSGSDVRDPGNQTSQTATPTTRQPSGTHGDATPTAATDTPAAGNDERPAGAGLAGRSLSFQLPAIRVAEFNAAMLQISERETPRIEVSRLSTTDLLSQLLLRVEGNGRLHVVAATASVEVSDAAPDRTHFVIEQSLRAGAVGATLGLLWWLQRLVLVFGSGLAAAPVWRRLDPVPVLHQEGKRPAPTPEMDRAHVSREELRT